MNLPKILPLLAVLALCGCEAVTSKKIVGDRVPVLDPKIWNGDWVDGEGKIYHSEIREAQHGVVVVTPLKPKAESNEPQFQEIELRMLGDRLIGNVKDKDTGLYTFGRVVATDPGMIAFPASFEKFASLVKDGKIAGKIEKNNDGKVTSCLIEGLPEQDYQRLVKAGVNPRDLFDENPAVVLLRKR